MAETRLGSSGDIQYVAVAFVTSAAVAVAWQAAVAFLSRCSPQNQGVAAGGWWALPVWVDQGV
ncbi:hypothetical protein GGTG_08066 [Gaeumannomyces tritici R3-111a-1]|uniref:Uncharacterized protein n=1 Tax=Gaeumannomyces tritici (strain R3-111a-1) TaxID=644352 RepID=J3P3I0_GAET3|nr:hypothetical protein GGTG_08066 [Gaeumannomyces tritici R3-111a-1]EJT74222.1 hypothetical protein GGTG_08066 [Gaeumannomyces tritici R3-111a-1]